MAELTWVAWSASAHVADGGTTLCGRALPPPAEAPPGDAAVLVVCAACAQGLAQRCNEMRRDIGRLTAAWAETERLIAEISAVCRPGADPPRPPPAPEPPRPAPEDLSARRAQILGFVREYHQRHGYAPSLRDIAVGTGMPLAGVVWHVEALARAGCLRRAPRRPRSLTLLRCEGADGRGA
jgi:hypothetical protein